MIKLFNKLRKDEEYRINILTSFIILSLVSFLVVAVFIGNTEFVYYDLVILPLIIFAYYTHKSLKVHFFVLSLLYLVFFMHMAGGTIYIQGVRLYDIPFLFLKYDNLVHFIGSFTAVFVSYSLVEPYVSRKTPHRDWFVLMILLLVAAGVGTLVEMVEFVGVIFILDAAKGVGGYFNNTLDLLVNFCGALTGGFVILQYHNKKLFKKIVKN
jgi:hypothetical protein